MTSIENIKAKIEETRDEIEKYKFGYDQIGTFAISLIAVLSAVCIPISLTVKGLFAANILLIYLIITISILIIERKFCKNSSLILNILDKKLKKLHEELITITSYNKL